VPLHNEGKIEVFDAVTGSPVDGFPVPPNPHSIVLSADGATGYVADHESGTVSVWDMRTLEQTGDLPAGNAPHRVALSPDGSQLAVVNFQGNDVWLFDTAAPSVLRKQVAVGSNPQDVAYAPDGRHLYTVNLNDDSLSVVDIASGEVTTVATGNEPTSIVLRADGSEAFVTVSAPPDGAPAGSTGNVSVFRTAG